MSQTNRWARRLEDYRYSQDERMLSYKFKKELEPKFEAMMASSDISMSFSYDVEREPWRTMAIKELARQYSMKISELATDDSPNIEYVVSKQKLSRNNLGK